jgi:hypothetical protein
VTLGDLYEKLGITEYTPPAGYEVDPVVEGQGRRQ